MKSIRNSGLVILTILFIYGCAPKVPTTNSPSTGNEPVAAAELPDKPTEKKEAYSPVGVWEYTVDTPDGGSSGVLRITGEPGSYEASLETDQFGTLEISDLEIVGTSMSGSIEVAGNSAEIEGDFDGDEFSGAVVLGDQVLPLEATRTSKGG